MVVDTLRQKLPLSQDGKSTCFLGTNMEMSTECTEVQDRKCHPQNSVRPGQGPKCGSRKQIPVITNGQDIKNDRARRRCGCAKPLKRTLLKQKDRGENQISGDTVETGSRKPFANGLPPKTIPVHSRETHQRQGQEVGNVLCAEWVVGPKSKAGCPALGESILLFSYKWVS